MSLSREEVLHIAQLARIGLTDADVQKFQEQLSHILDQFAALRRIDTTGVPPTTFALPLENVWREDIVQPSLPVEDVLANAPAREGDFIRVRRVLEWLALNVGHATAAALALLAGVASAPRSG